MELLSSLPEFQQIPPPFLFNGLKHHIGVLGGLVRRWLSVGSGEDEVLSGLTHDLMVLGNGLMDMYHGPLSVAEVFVQVEAALRGLGAWEESAYRTWIAEAGSFQRLTLSDDSIWVLLPTDVEGRYIHLHPGRYSPHTTRLRGNAVKTAAAAVAYAQLAGHTPTALGPLNDVRSIYLDLSPIRALEPDGGLVTAMGHLLSSMEVEATVA